MFNTNSMVTPLKYNNSIILDVQPGISTLTTNVLLQVILSYTSNATLAADLSFVNFMLAPSNTTVHPIQQLVVTATLPTTTTTTTTLLSSISQSTSTATVHQLVVLVKEILVFDLDITVDVVFQPCLLDSTSACYKNLLQSLKTFVSSVFRSVFFLLTCFFINVIFICY